MPKERIILSLNYLDVGFLDDCVKKGISPSRNALCARLIQAYRADVERNHQCPERALDKYITFTQKMLGN